MITLYSLFLLSSEKWPVDTVPSTPLGSFKIKDSSIYSFYIGQNMDNWLSSDEGSA